MKFKHGGYTPRIAGRPSGNVDVIPPQKNIRLTLLRNGMAYKPLITSGAPVKTGDLLAEAKIGKGKVFLPSPCAGKAVLNSGKKVSYINITDIDPEDAATTLNPMSLSKASRGELVDALCRGGAWQYFWSSARQAIPDPAGETGPSIILINCILTEPFRARGNIVISNWWDSIVQGIRFLEHLTAEYGRIEIILTSPKSPLAKKMYDDLRGFAWVRFHDVPRRYPVENRLLMTKELKRAVGGTKIGGDIWVIDVQGVKAVGECLAEGRPAATRLIGLGGPGEKNPRHVEAGIGTPWSAFLGDDADGNIFLRGGLINGTVTGEDERYVTYDDDAVFVLPEMKKGEFLTFIRPGFNRTSYSRTFVSKLTRGVDRHITNSLRGELRPCIGCGLCEEICPACIMPQIIHRYLYRDAIDEAEKSGLFKCVDCNLCTYICPSKIELQAEFANAREQILSERKDTLEEA
ncbi:MAG: 4Fe-4S dicluster domain-containing protein [Spirochaetales bacterium]|nr:MAG: 4Fe-4S dicluster domain-containing protein [Spirochaetales bacterium]